MNEFELKEMSNNSELKADINKNRTKRQKLSSTTITKDDPHNDTTLSKRYGVGAKILAQMGYVKGQGLGATGTGIVEPIQAVGMMKRAGLGMLSAVRGYDTEEESPPASSSDDDDEFGGQGEKRGSGVIFERSRVIDSQNGSSSGGGSSARQELLTKISALAELDSQIAQELEKSLYIVTDETLERNKLEIKDALEELEELSEKIDSLSNTQIPLIEKEFDSIVVYETLLNELIALKSGSITFQQTLELIPQILDAFSPEDTARSDKLLSRLFLKLFRNNLEFGSLGPEINDSDNDDATGSDNKSEELAEFLNKLPILLKPLDSLSDIGTGDNNRLNETQTVLFNLWYPKFEPYWNKIDFYSEEAVDMALSTILRYEPFLKYIKCYKPVIANYIEPQLVKFFHGWSLDSDARVSFSVIDFKLLDLDQSTVLMISESLINKLETACKEWNLEEPVAFSSSCFHEYNMLFLKEFLGYEPFYKVVKRYLVPRFVKDLWDMYFDPLIELEEWDSHICNKDIPNSNSDKAESEKGKGDDNDDGIITESFSGTGLCMHQLRNFHNIFSPNEYNKLVKATFNELNKILYQWIIYAEDRQMRSEARSWFNWFINSYFKSPVLPLQIEIDEIKGSLSFLDKYCELDSVSPDTVIPIHTETESCENDYDYDSDSDSDVIVISESDNDNERYNIQNIPMQRIQPSFRDVVEDYCEEHGYVLRKLDNRYAQLPNSSVLVPVFEVSNYRSKRYICIKDDALWVESEGGYKPMYLWQLKLDG